MLIDQSPRDNGAPYFVFDKPCWSTIGPAYIYARTRIPVHPVSRIKITMERSTRNISST
jgi:hypothetical protein